MSLIKFLMEVRSIPSWDRTPAISDQELDKLIQKTKSGLLHRPLFQFGKKGTISSRKDAGKNECSL